MSSERVAILGASPKPDRYSFKALQALRAAGHVVLPVHPIYREIEGIEVYPSLSALQAPVDTVTLYLSPDTAVLQQEALLALHPRRAIFNPGTESPSLMEALRRAGVEVVEGCTLVMLRTGQF